eukprot:m.215290 g.215290  ORF g.215290 m.215290 type:complete len:111 (+) comp19091_c0_seq1:37-369(+)
MVCQRGCSTILSLLHCSLFCMCLNDLVSNTCPSMSKPTLVQRHHDLDCTDHCIRRQQTGGAWLRISDSNVAEVPFSAVMTAQPYMVFYEAFVPRKLSDLVADDVTRFLSK